MSLYGQQIGRQPIRAGMHSYFRGPQQVNINHKEVTYNNFGGMGYDTGIWGGYGGYDCGGGMSKGEKLMVALGAILGIGGAVAGAFINDGSKPKDTDSSDSNDTVQELKKQLLEQDKEHKKKLQEMSERHQKQIDEMLETARASKAQQTKQTSTAEVTEHTTGAREVAGKDKTTPYTVTAKKNDDGTYTGDTGYNIVAGKYKSADGKPLTNSEIKAIASEIFQGKALPTGEIHLPNTVTVNGNTYNIDPKGEVRPSTYTLDNHQIYQSSARQEGSKWIATLDGKDLDGEYSTEAEAKEAAEKEAAKLKESDK